MLLFVAEVRFSTMEHGQIKEHHQEYEMTAESSAMAWMRMAQRVQSFFKQRPESQIRVKKMDVRLAK